ncbi:MAG: LolA family protein [Armatimonadota bacterium]
MSRLQRLAVVAVTVAAGCIVLAQTDIDPLEILRRSIAARTSVDYSGVRTVVVFENGRKVHGVQQRIHCDAPDKLHIVVVAPEEQAGRLCITNGRVRWDYDPDTGRAVQTHVPHAKLVTQQRLREMERLGQRMKLQYVGTESIVGRPVHVVKVYTREGLPLKKTWVDMERFLPLKTQRFDSHGQVRSSAYYTSIDLTPSFPPGLFDFTPPPDAKVVQVPSPGDRMPLAKAQQRVGFQAALPTYLPPGYHFQRDSAAVLEIGGRKALWLSFTNGADTFSLFQRPGSGPATPLHQGRSITWEDGGFRFILMGTLSDEEMRRVRASIRP